MTASPIAVRDAHYVKHDVPADAAHRRCNTGAGTGRRSRGAATGRRRWIVAGAAAGLAMSTHYYAIFLAVADRGGGVVAQRCAGTAGGSFPLAGRRRHRRNDRVHRRFTVSRARAGAVDGRISSATGRSSWTAPRTRPDCSDRWASICAYWVTTASARRDLLALFGLWHAVKRGRAPLARAAGSFPSRSCYSSATHSRRPAT